MAVLDTPRSRNRRILSSLPSSRETPSEPLRAAELPARGLGPGEALASTLGIRSRSTSANSAKSVVMTLVWMSRLPSTRIFSLSATLSRYRVFLHESGRYPVCRRVGVRPPTGRMAPATADTRQHAPATRRSEQVASRARGEPGTQPRHLRGRADGDATVRWRGASACRRRTVHRVVSGRLSDDGSYRFDALAVAEVEARALRPLFA